MAMRRSFLACLATLVVAAACSAASGTGQIVRLQTAIQPPISVDGTLAAGEWPAPVDPAGGAEVMLGESGGYLQVGLRTEPLFVASLCLARGDTVRIFHASSALGRATYVRRGDEWRLTENFEWRMRRTDPGPDAERERSEHRARFGWIASTVTMGAPGETEFQIDTVLSAGSGSSIAIGTLPAGDDPDTAGWPGDLASDGCMRRSVIAGPLPESVAFRPERWPRLEHTSGR